MSCDEGNINLTCNYTSLKWSFMIREDTVAYFIPGSRKEAKEGVEEGADLAQGHHGKVPIHATTIKINSMLLPTNLLLL